MKKLSKKIIIILIILLIVSVAVITLFKIRDKSKIEKGYELFGKETCQGHDLHEMAGTAITSWKCAICKKQYNNSTTSVPSLCGKCSEITNRCNKCGKLLTKDSE